MTTLDLLTAVKDFVKSALKDVVLTKNTYKELGKNTETKAEVYIGYIPEKEGDYDKAAPYVLLQAPTGEDDEDRGITTCNIRFVIVLHFADEKEGALGVNEIIERLRIALRKEGVLNGQYGIGKISWLIYPSDSTPYYVGEMMVEFGMVNVKPGNEAVRGWLNDGEAW